MSVVDVSPLAAPARTAPQPAAAFTAATALRSFTGDVSASRLKEMLRGSGMDSCWLVGPRWALLEQLWRERADDAAATAAITSYDASASS